MKAVSFGPAKGYSRKAQQGETQTAPPPRATNPLRDKGTRESKYKRNTVRQAVQQQVKRGESRAIG